VELGATVAVAGGTVAVALGALVAVAVGSMSVTTTTVSVAEAVVAVPVGLGGTLVLVAGATVALVSTAGARVAVITAGVSAPFVRQAASATSSTRSETGRLRFIPHLLRELTAFGTYTIPPCSPRGIGRMARHTLLSLAGKRYAKTRKKSAASC
jgi:hypothetical protein